jgi:hypothetical protein
VSGDDFVIALAARLFARIDTGVMVSRRDLADAELKMRPNDCHRNALLVCEKYQQYTPVRGWHAADYIELGCYQFFSHSVVADKAGNLIDFTPNPAPWSYPFIPHDPADGDFADIVEGKGMVSITHRLS